MAQWLGLSASTAGGTRSIPGWGTKIPHAPCSSPPLQEKTSEEKKNQGVNLQ